MKEKIEEILLRNNNWKADEDEVEIFGVEFSRETMDKVIKELSTLIQEERKEAVEGFARDCEERNKRVFHRFPEGTYLETAKEYLESEGK